ncbi:hypothetical protein BJ138DRAFT_1157186 [Hygrophoropsis aurantiaca]|uniref:Uncharacterized protein n=1 Tax=Hygrophoropsis aurantiaca TaxID=72124 RepID=A0ACB8A6E4_9AGAM|nr:hypothetical protein BJ138DRAFT_1157186 [Hygrophoropsis aurantiaca]
MRELKGTSLASRLTHHLTIHQGPSTPYRERLRGARDSIAVHRVSYPIHGYLKRQHKQDEESFSYIPDIDPVPIHRMVFPVVSHSSSTSQAGMGFGTLPGRLEFPSDVIGDLPLSLETEHRFLTSSSSDGDVAPMHPDPALSSRIVSFSKIPSASLPMDPTKGDIETPLTHTTPHRSLPGVPLNARPLPSESVVAHKVGLPSSQESVYATPLGSPMGSPTFLPELEMGSSDILSSPPARTMAVPDPTALSRNSSPPRASTPFVPDLSILSRKAAPPQTIGPNMQSGPASTPSPTPMLLDLPPTASEVVNIDEDTWC